MTPYSTGIVPTTNHRRVFIKDTYQLSQNLIVTYSLQQILHNNNRVSFINGNNINLNL